MYLKYYGFSRRPFDLAPEIQALFLGETHKEGLAVLKYGVISDKGFLLLTGGVGTGKTSLINCLAASLQMTDSLCLISNPNLKLAEFYYFFAAKIGLKFDGNKAKFLLLFAEYLDGCRRTEQRNLLIIDEAHILGIELLEEIRLLANLAAEHPGTLSIFLVGQPELQDRLADSRLLPLRQRIALRFHLEPLSRKDTLQYILFRLNGAGAQQNALFTEQAVDDIHLAANGNPRVINTICDQALLIGYSRNVLHVNRKIIRECIEQHKLPGDEQFYHLPANKPIWKKWLFWLLLVVLCLDGLGLWFAFRLGLLDGIWQWIQNFLK